MKKQNSKTQNRVWIILNYLSLIAGMLLFYAVKIYHLPVSFLMFEIAIFAIFLFILLFSLFAIQIVEDVRMILPLLLPVNVAIAMLISYFRPTYCIIFDSETGKYSVKKC